MKWLRKYRFAPALSSSFIPHLVNSIPNQSNDVRTTGGGAEQQEVIDTWDVGVSDEACRAPLGASLPPSSTVSLVAMHRLWTDPSGVGGGEQAGATVDRPLRRHGCARYPALAGDGQAPGGAPVCSPPTSSSPVTPSSNVCTASEPSVASSISILSDAELVVEKFNGKNLTKLTAMA